MDKYKKCVCILSVLTILLLILTYTYKQTRTFSTMKLLRLKHSMPAGNYFYQDVCIEPVGRQVSLNKIVVYNSKRTTSTTIHVATGHSLALTKSLWAIHFVKESIPPTHQVLNHNGYFIQAQCTGNLFHFWNEFLLGLYGLMKLTGASSDVTQKHDVITEVSTKSKASGCESGRYAQLLHALPVARFTSLHEHNTSACYRRAFFGFVTSNVNPHELESYVKNSILHPEQGLSHYKQSCPTKPLMLIQTRAYRTLLNAQEVSDLAESVGFEPRVLRFEQLAVAEQLRLVDCATVLLGVQGAGLEWFRFMRQPAWLLEVGWPGWPAGMYTTAATRLGYTAREINDLCAPEVGQASWETYAHVARKRLPQTGEERGRILGRPVLDSEWPLDSNVWKYADCTLNVTALRAVLTEISPH